MTDSAVGAPSPLVQLLTPEGERVEHPDYAFDLTDERAPRRSTATWCWSGASTPRPPPCSGRASWASGPRCSARRPRRSAPAARCATQDYAFPTYREHGVAWCRGVDPLHAARPVPRRRTTAAGTRTSTTSTSTRSSSARRPCTPPATRWASSATAVGTATDGRASSPTSATAPPARATSTRRSSSPASTTRRSSSSARTTSGRSPSRSSGRPGSRCTSAPAGFGFPGVRVDGNDVLAVLRGHPKAALDARPRRARARR